MTILTMLQVDLRISDVKNIIEHESERYTVMEQLYSGHLQTNYSCLTVNDFVKQNLTDTD